MINEIEYKNEKEFASKNIAPFYRDYYLKRYQLLRMNDSQEEARKKAIQDLQELEAKGIV